MDKNPSTGNRSIDQVNAVSNHQTKTKAVTNSGTPKRMEIIKIFGTIDFNKRYDYKKERKTR